eukprot:654788-Pleurochrysis_carterae.AAC.1
MARERQRNRELSANMLPTRPPVRSRRRTHAASTAVSAPLHVHSSAPARAPLRRARSCAASRERWAPAPPRWRR